MKIKTQTSFVRRLVLTLLSWYGLQRLQSSPFWALACSLSACAEGEIYAPSEPVDTNLMVVFPKNTTCSVIQLPLACSGCSSCDSQYLYEWGDETSGFTVDDFICSTAMNPDNGISCADLVFGNITFDGDHLSTNFAGHCGWDDNSGRDICPWADSILSGGVQVCLANETKLQETEPIIIRDIVLRYVGFACVANGTIAEETKPPKASPANGTTAMPTTTNGTISPIPTPSPTMSPTTASPTTLPSTEVNTEGNALRSVATNTPSAAAARLLVIHPTWYVISTSTVLVVMAGIFGRL